MSAGHVTHNAQCGKCGGSAKRVKGRWGMIWRHCGYTFECITDGEYERRTGLAAKAVSGSFCPHGRPDFRMCPHCRGL